MSELLSIRGVRAGRLLDEPLMLSAAGEGLRWLARYRDDDLRVWRAAAGQAEDLLTRFLPAKPSSGPIAALSSLRPVRIDVRVEAADGRAAGRAVTRLLVAEGVRLRRWRFGGLTGVLHLPAPGREPCATVVVDGSAGANEAAVAGLAGPLLASRGALVLCVTAGPLDEAIERLADVPGSGAGTPLAAADPLGAEPLAGVPLPPGVGVRGEPDGGAAAREAAWDALLARLGAVSRLWVRLG